MGCCREFAGIIRDCDANIGGIKRAWIACFDEAGNPTILNGEITALGSTDVWYEYEFRKLTGSLTATWTYDDATGSAYWDIAVILQFSKMETSKRLEIVALSQSDIALIIEDNNGKYWYVSFDYQANMTDGTAQTGTAFTDLNGYNLTFTSLSKEPPMEVTAAAMLDIINPTPDA